MNTLLLCSPRNWFCQRPPYSMCSPISSTTVIKWWEWQPWRWVSLSLRFHKPLSFLGILWSFMALISCSFKVSFIWKCIIIAVFGVFRKCVIVLYFFPFRCWPRPELYVPLYAGVCPQGLYCLWAQLHPAQTAEWWHLHRAVQAHASNHPPQQVWTQTLSVALFTAAVLSQYSRIRFLLDVINNACAHPATSARKMAAVKKVQRHRDVSGRASVLTKDEIAIDKANRYANPWQKLLRNRKQDCQRSFYSRPRQTWSMTQEHLSVSFVLHSRASRSSLQKYFFLLRNSSTKFMEAFSLYNVVSSAQ